MFTKQQTILRDLGDGLILRRSTPEDADALSEFNRMIHTDNAPDGQCIATWTRDLLTRPHPTFHPDDFTIVEEPATGRIVSSMNWISQTWSYEGIQFGVGRPELVGTLAEFRNRGLVRIQFEEVHKWSAERGEIVQAITGIPFYYRQFGYEMALDLDGRRFGSEAQLPKVSKGESESYMIRAAQERDLPFIETLYDQTKARSMVWCERTPELFRYELLGRGEDNNCGFDCILEDHAGEPVGYFRHSGYCQGGTLGAWRYEVKPGVSWLKATPSVARYLWAKGQEYAKRDGAEFNLFGFVLGAAHPAYEALGNHLPTIRDPYAWYLRVPDLRGFLDHIQPVLEKRLAESFASGHSCEIKISFYRSGLRFVIEKGKLTTIAPWQPSPEDGGVIAFPGLVFLQMLFGYRGYDELQYTFADCWCDSEEVRALIKILFPKKLSNVYPIA
jgi:GNAT acetyltransferase-like protein